MVLALWAGVPDLASGRPPPQPVLVAADALALAIHDTELQQDEDTVEVLHGALQMLWFSHFALSCRRDEASPIDKRLFDCARAALRTPWLQGP